MSDFDDERIRHTSEEIRQLRHELRNTRFLVMIAIGLCAHLLWRWIDKFGW